jgi:hypothetical protein
MAATIKKWVPVLASVWAFLAFFVWHFESRCGAPFSPSCIPYYWEGARWVVLFKWLNPYQTLIAGLAAVIGGWGAVYAARLTVDAARELGRQQQRDVLVANASYLSEMFRQVQFLQRPDQLADFPARWDHIPEAIRATIPAYPQLLSDCLFLWGEINRLAAKGPTPLGYSKIRAQSAIASVVLADIVAFYQSSLPGKYIPNRIPSPDSLTKTLVREQAMMSLEGSAHDLLKLTEPMPNYIEIKEPLR